MVALRPFKGLRYNPRRVGGLENVICPPYDVISPSEQRALYDRSPYNLVRVELGLDQPGDDERDNRYTRAAAILAAWRSEGALMLEPAPALYLHQASFSLHGQSFTRRDLLVAVMLEPWERGVVLPHERTMAQPKEDRLRLLRATATQVSPVWTLYRGTSAALAETWNIVQARPPQQQFRADNGVEHRLWSVTDPRLHRRIQQEFADRRLYIADGHHRYETALAYQRERHEVEGEGVSGPYDAVFSVITSAEDPGLRVLPIHRLLRGVGPEPEAALRAVLDGAATLEAVALPGDVERARAAVEDLAAQLGQGPGQRFCALVAGGQRAIQIRVVDPSRALASKAEGHSAAWRALDVAVLHALIVEPLLRRAGVRLEDSVRFTHAAAEALDAVRRGEAELALLVAPTRVEQVLAVADARDRMPQKSTFFVPKPPSGLVLYPLRDEA